MTHAARPPRDAQENTKCPIPYFGLSDWLVVAGLALLFILVSSAMPALPPASLPGV